MEKITSSQIREALKLRYPAPTHALLFEVANGTGSNQRRFADAVAVGLWPSHGHEIEGIEIKVSRADFLNEMKCPEKSQEVYQYCNRWWLATPKGMVEPCELPPTWGLLEIIGGIARVKVKAPKITPCPLSVNFLAALIRRSAGADEEMSRGIIEREVHIRERVLRSEILSAAERNARLKIAEAKTGMEKVEEIKKHTGIDLTNHIPTDQWVNAINYLCSTSRVGFNERAVDSLRRQAALLIQSIDNLPKLKKDTGDAFATDYVREAISTPTDAPPTPMPI